MKEPYRVVLDHQPHIGIGVVILILFVTKQTNDYLKVAQCDW